MNMKQSELDPCVFYWYHEGTIGGLIALHVDDMVIGGNEEFHEKVLRKLKQRYPFKHWKIGGGKFLGRELVQQSDSTISCHQTEHAKQVETIKISKERRTQRNEPVNEKERKQLRGVIGAANWLTGSTRPDIAAAAGHLQQRITKAVVQDLIEANKLVSKIKDFAHVTLNIRPIDFQEGMLLVATDASWGNSDDLKSQAGYVLAFCEKKMKDGKRGQVTPLRSKSYKQDRHTQSTLGAELMALARGISEGEWIRSLFAECLNETYTLETDRQLREGLDMVVTIDNRPIFDHTIGDGIVIKDKRMAIDMLLVRRDIKCNNICLRWVDTGSMLADCLTKLSASAGLLLDVFRNGLYSLVLEASAPEKL